MKIKNRMHAKKEAKVPGANLILPSMQNVIKNKLIFLSIMNN